jgi:ArsR family transcriptional regulator
MIVPLATREPIVFSQLAALSDATRCRLLLALEQQELTVRELRQVLQLPQSTISRHLRVLADEGWVRSRASGTSNWYRMSSAALAESARQLWQVVRSQARATAASGRDAERLRSVLAERQIRSREFFATSAGQWDKLRSELFGRGAVVGPFLGLLQAEWVVADLGCGTGQLAEQLAARVGRVIAIDDSTAMLDAARQRLAALDNVELHAASLEHLPLVDGSVDLAFIVLVLHHLAEPAPAVREAGRVLRPGGRLVIVDMLPHEHAEYRDLMGHQWLGFDRNTVEAWCGESGLGALAFQPIAPDPEAHGPTLFVASATRLSAQIPLTPIPDPRGAPCRTS